MGVVFSLSSMPKGYMKGWGLYLLASHINRGSLGIKLGFGRARGVHGPEAQLAARRPIVQAGDSGVGGRRLRSRPETPVSSPVSSPEGLTDCPRVGCWGRSGGRFGDSGVQAGDSGVAGPETPV